jgi:2-desacetyl-2-hydroxyethyl bacteriochlorophyllide A dehydrogenase
MGVCGTDVAGYLGKMPFIDYPRILGHELGVEVIEVGDEVTNAKVGDRCAVEPYLNCGDCHACRQGKTNCCESLRVLGVHVDGGLCESLTLPATKLHVANNLTFEQLALVEMLGIGCHAVDRAQLKAHEEVLILGAGPIGMTVLEFALLAGAAVSIYEPGATRREFVRQLYPEATVLEERPAERSAQIVFDATGNATSMNQAFHFARFTGRIVFVGITKDPVVLDDPLLHRRELTLLASRNAVAADFTHILDLMKQGRLRTPQWVTHRCSMDETPAEMRAWTAPSSNVIKATVHVTTEGSSLVGCFRRPVP